MAGRQQIQKIRRELKGLASADVAEFLQGFFKTAPGEYGEGDRFLGIRVPELRRLARSHRELSLENAAQLLDSKWHEERLLALIVLVERARRGSDADRAAIYDLYLAKMDRINQWDLVDVSAGPIVGGFLDPADIGLLENLAASESVWERRIAIVATFPWIKQGIFEPTLRIARRLLHDPHDLIHKAVGWMLREIGKRDRAQEKAFLQRHYRHMPRTMLRYAIEHFPQPQRLSYLQGKK